MIIQRIGQRVRLARPTYVPTEKNVEGFIKPGTGRTKAVAIGSIPAPKSAASPLPDMLSTGKTLDEKKTVKLADTLTPDELKELAAWWKAHAAEVESERLADAFKALPGNIESAIHWLDSGQVEKQEIDKINSLIHSLKLALRRADRRAKKKN